MSAPKFPPPPDYAEKVIAPPAFYRAAVEIWGQAWADRNLIALRPAPLH